MTSRGFTLLELLVAMVVVLLLSAAIAGAAAEARAVFDRVPAVIDMQQRGNAVIDTLSRALRGALRVTVELPDDEDGYSQLTVVAPIASPAQGVLAIDQLTPASSITLAPWSCPNVKDVCGFTSGSVAMIVDGPDFDIFIVGSTDAAQRRLTPLHPLSRVYAAGSRVLEVEHQIFGLDEQADGTYSLTRVTAAGAVQPIVDGIRSISFDLDGQRVEIRVVVHASPAPLQRVIEDRTFTASIRARNAS